ncbi:hypothetical protein TNCV_3702151 [Trichonephila clavipes]|nr:hypothetical protein TNCV_3702151 [Trichonephila clavipes]
MVSLKLFQPIIRYSDSRKGSLRDSRTATPLVRSSWISRRLSTVEVLSLTGSTNQSAPSRVTALRREIHLRDDWNYNDLRLALLYCDDVTSSSCTINLFDGNQQLKEARLLVSRCTQVDSLLPTI